MNILFLTMSDIHKTTEHSLYMDLIRVLAQKGHSVCVVTPLKGDDDEKAGVTIDRAMKIQLLKVNLRQNHIRNMIHKGITTLLVDYRYLIAIKRFFSHEKFDLVLYSTPPITLCRTIKYIKERDDATTYLMLKDIFPQNAVDIGLLSGRGIKKLIVKYFEKKERTLYALSDRIGCMSKANCEYLQKKNVKAAKLEVCPNCIIPTHCSLSEDQKKGIREKYNLPTDKIIFVYGGNLGKPQGIDFMIDCINSISFDNVFFLIIGDGTEFGKIEKEIQRKKQRVGLMKKMPQEEYQLICAACDVGMIFLDFRFTIPNYPSRLLGYLETKLPVLACTDMATDIGENIIDGGFGWWCPSNDIVKFRECVCDVISSDRVKMGRKGFDYMKKNYNIEYACDCILGSVHDNSCE